MKTLSNRREVADYVNVQRTATVRIDLAASDDYGLVSQKVAIDNGFCMIYAEVRAFIDEKKFTFDSYGPIICDGFSYYDFEEMILWRNAPVIEPDSDVVLMIVDSVNKVAYKPLVLHTDKRVNPQCSTPLKFIDTDKSAEKYLKHVNKIFNKDWY